VIEDQGRSAGVIYLGTTAEAIPEAVDLLAEQGLHYDLMRLRGFPFGEEVWSFIDRHEQLYVVDQNRDAQLRSLLMIEGDVSPDKLVSITHYDGMPVTASFLRDAIAGRAEAQSAERKSA
ncbi:MAG TPA: 2-oxoacid:acceptor oxidoreductase subunit alpha, partial [Gammaproteobacteria bacterium]|nr:2-oxoacid:acceptor oxidoreductase subunit alpha [Gammaproteobacteria bacterium]